MPQRQLVQTFGRKKNSVAVATVRSGAGLIRVNGQPLDLINPQVLRVKLYEPVLLLGGDVFSEVDIRVRTRGGGHTTNIFAIRQAIARGIVAYYQKYKDESSKRDIKEKLLHFDRSLLVVDARRCESKKFGGP